VSGIVLDAGALIALERRDQALWRVTKAVIAKHDEVYVPSTVVAQVWRGSRSQAVLARILEVSVIVPFDPLARRIGELCGRANRADICDAHVALFASLQDVDAVYTSDPDDIAHLLATCGFPSRVVRC
jgi:predicted nucleic acid-binding protein